MNADFGPRIRLKMCGMTNIEDIQFAAALGVDAIGLIFYEASPRCMTLKKATVVLQHIPAFLDVVAVFVNPSADEVTQVLEHLPIQYLQFHGDESAEFCEQFNHPYIKAIAAESSSAMLKATSNFASASALLFDTPCSARGGSGTSFDWHLIPKNLTMPLIIAGGVEATSIRKLAAFKPYAIDVCSGIEERAGVKDHQKMIQLVNALWGKND